MSGGRPTGEGEGVLQSQRAGLQGEARRGAIIRGKTPSARDSANFFDGYLPPKIATTTTRAILGVQGARAPEGERAGRTKDQWVTYSPRGTTGHLYISVHILQSRVRGSDPAVPLERAWSYEWRINLTPQICESTLKLRSVRTVASISQYIGPTELNTSVGYGD